MVAFVGWLVVRLIEFYLRTTKKALSGCGEGEQIAATATPPLGTIGNEKAKRTTLYTDSSVCYYLAPVLSPSAFDFRTLYWDRPRLFLGSEVGTSPTPLETKGCWSMKCIVQSVDFGCCLPIGIVQTIGFGCCPPLAIVQTTHFECSSERV